MKKLPIITILIFIFLIQVVLAANVCCEQTTGGQYCQYVDETQCDPEYRSAYTSCEQTSYCQVGCCFTSDEGTCFKQTPKATCNYEDGTWTESPDCAIDQCQKGCCIIEDQASFVTEVQCKRVTSQFEEAEMDFRLDITFEQECVAVARNQDQGCCVTGEGTAVFTTRGACEVEQGARVINGTQQTGFFKDMLCSNDLLSTGCAKQQTTNCVGEDLYWFDSCGNQENIYNSNREASYNKGYVLSESASCKANGPEDSNCGNCDYPSGTICGADENNRMSVGNKTCVDLNCKEIYADEVSPNAGSAKKNGESWCIYDSIPGRARDAVGSRHYRHLCINGEEITDPCKDFREEICIQGVVGEETTSLYEALIAQGDYVEAACRINRWQGCASCNDILGEEGITSGSLERAEKCCTDDYRDCYWFTGSVGEDASTDAYRKETPICIPEVPPGLKFWSDTTGEDSTPTPSTEAVSQCAFANKECKVVRERGGWSRLFDIKDWDITANEFCTDKEWAIAGNNLCKAMGDCGAYYNVEGTATFDGFYNSQIDETNWFDGKDNELKAADLDDWETLSHPPKKGAKGKDFWSRFTNHNKGYSAYIIGFGFAASGVAGGIGGAYQGKGGAEGFATGFANGMNPLSSTVLGGIGKGGIGDVFSTGVEIGGKTFAAGTPVTGSQLGTEVALDSAINEGLVTKISSDGTYKFTQDQLINAGFSPEKASEIALKDFSQKEAQSIVGEKIALENGLTETVKGSGQYTVQAGGGAQFASYVNTALWIYTIYTTVDVLAAQSQSHTYKIECKPWVPPAGGADCEKCNENEKPCSEYKCRSYGASCKLVNEGTEEEKCIDSNVNDVNSPIITPLVTSFKAPYNEITEKTEEGIQGYEIKNNIPAFTTVNFGIETDEPSQCKYSIEPKTKFEAMTQTFGTPNYDYKHKMSVNLNGLLVAEEAMRKTDGLYTLYVRCQDANENKNERDYYIRFKVDPSPDLTPPSIEFTSINNDAFVALNTTEIPFSIYVNEPAECKWDRRDTGFDVMENTFTCDTAQMSYSSLYANTYQCDTTLTNIAIGNNIFYIRCGDKPDSEQSAVMEESFEFKLKGTKDALTISNLEPEGTTDTPKIIYSDNLTIKVTTEGGAERGIATCAWADKEGTSFSGMTQFLKTKSSFHEQQFIDHPKGTYTYYVVCQDVGGNEVRDQTTLTIEVDNIAPRLISLYIDPLYGELHLKLSEKATCEFSDQKTFVFGEGTPFQASGETQIASLGQFTTYYIQCQDTFENKASFTVHV